MECGTSWCGRRTKPHMRAKLSSRPRRSSRRPCCRWPHRSKYAIPSKVRSTNWSVNLKECGKQWSKRRNSFKTNLPRSKVDCKQNKRSAKISRIVLRITKVPSCSDRKRY